MRRTLAAALALSVTLAAPLSAQSPTAPVRYIDAHSHIAEGLTLDEEIAAFRQAGLAGVVIMHPDAPALQALAIRNKGYVVPFISLARLPQMAGLRLSPGTAATMTGLYAAGATCGFGEIPTRIVPRTEPTDDLSLLNADRMRIYAEASRLRLPVNLHVDIASPQVEASIDLIAKLNRNATIVIAHAGWSADPKRIERLMAGNRNVMADLSVRLDPIGGLPADPLAPGSLPPGAADVISILQNDGTIQPAWAALLRRFPDRFLFAMDITQSQRPKYIGLLLETARKALSPLGAGVENAVAHGNFERITASCRAGVKR